MLTSPGPTAWRTVPAGGVGGGGLAVCGVGAAFEAVGQVAAVKVVYATSRIG
jgi:hypothetical protein